ncbi:hypothetical protein K439DRAFT_1661378 [Ramaria rubella]|nr:hypothetical protein K439DRAFT_1661378 [Ramaria rubella]
MEAFKQPNCPASFPTSSTAHSTITLQSVHNDALVYLAVAVATFAAVPSFLWLRERRRKSRERRRNRAVVESIKSKMDAAKALEAVVPPPVAVVEPSVVDEQEERDAEDNKEKKKRSKDRRKRNREPSKSIKSKKSLTSSTRALTAQRESDHTPRAPEQPTFTSSHMPDIASPMPVSLISTPFHPPSPSPSRSETSSQPGHTRSTSASSTTAPLTPPSLPPTRSLANSISISKENDAETWTLQLPRSDPAWDWDGQSSTYSSGSRAPSAASRIKPVRRELLHHASSSPVSPLMPSAPSLVFPSLNAHPPPGASLSTQIASLKGALEASRTREEMHRREAERWSKECDLVKWRWNEASDLWRRRESELQVQMHHLMHQLQTLTHTIQTASLSPPMASLSFSASQSPFPLAMTFPPHHHPASPFAGGIHSFTGSSDTVNEGLVEAILKRPQGIRPSTSSAPISASTSRTSTRSAESSCERSGACTQAVVDGEPKPKQAKTDAIEEVIEFEFPTLLERRVVTPQIQETVSNTDEVEIFK